MIPPITARPAYPQSRSVVRQPPIFGHDTHHSEATKQPHEDKTHRHTADCHHPPERPGDKYQDNWFKKTFFNFIGWFQEAYKIIRMNLTGKEEHPHHNH